MGNFNEKTEGNTIVSSFPSQVKDKTFLITGPSANSIGAETAITLARGKPAMLLLLGRSLANVQPTIDTIAEVSPSTITKYIVVDLSSLASVRNAALAILNDKEVQKIDVVINNAGIMACPYEKTVDGFEKQFATNHLSHFLLTNLLTPLILKAEKPRIVNVASMGHTSSAVNFDDIGFQNDHKYDVINAYGQSKTANILFTVALNERFAARNIGAVSWALHPGTIVSNLQRYVTDELRARWLQELKDAGQVPVLLTAQQGCATTLRAALDPELGSVKDSCYLTACEVVQKGNELMGWALDREAAERLWLVSEQMVGEKFSF